MALTLPANFASAIQGRNTSLVPVVVIGDLIGIPTVAHLRMWFESAIHISTNQVFYYDYRDDTDDDRISFHVKSFGGNVMMTSKNHESGTDRCGEVLENTSEYFEHVAKNTDSEYIMYAPVTCPISQSCSVWSAPSQSGAPPTACR